MFRGGEVLLVRERVDGRWTLPGGWADPGADHEIEAVGWFHPHDPPPLSIGRVTAEQLSLVARHRDDTRLPTEFD